MLYRLAADIAGDSIASYGMLPANNLNTSAILTPNSTTNSETGVLLNTNTLAIETGQMVSPLYKTMSNCVMGSMLASGSAKMAYDQLSAIDINAMLGGLDPVAQINTLITSMKS